MPRQLHYLVSPVGRAANEDTQPPGRPLDGGLSERPALVRVLGEPLAARAVDHDAVHALRDIVIDERACGVEVERAVLGERGDERGKVASPVDVVAVHSCSYQRATTDVARSSEKRSGNAGTLAGATICSASCRAKIGLKVNPVEDTHAWKPGTRRDSPTTGEKSSVNTMT